MPPGIGWNEVRALAKKPDILPYKIFVGGRPWEDFTKEEKESYGRVAAERMGQVFNGYFGAAPEVYRKFRGQKQ